VFTTSGNNILLKNRKTKLTVGAVTNPIEKLVERDNIDTPNTHLNNLKIMSNPPELSCKITKCPSNPMDSKFSSLPCNYY
jgi:hypothetical protein